MSEATANISPTFIAGVERLLAYWCARTSDLNDAKIAELDWEEPNLARVVQYGLVIPETRDEAQILVMQTIRWIERGGHAPGWLPILGRVLQEPQLPASPQTVALLNHYGFLLSRDEKVPAAISAHEKAAAMARMLNDPALTAEVNFYLSDAQRLAHNYRQARELGLTALATFEALPATKRWQAAVLNTLGLIDLDTGRHETALQWFSRSVTLWHETSDRTELARAVNNLARTYHAQGDRATAVVHYEKAHELLAPTASALEKARVHLSLGTLYFEQDNLDAAEKEWRAIDGATLERGGDLFAQAALAQNLANLYLKRGEWESGEYFCQQAITLWQEIEDEVMLANSTGTLAELLAHQGAVAASNAHYQAALAMLRRYPDDGRAQSLIHDIETRRRAHEDSPVTLH